MDAEKATVERLPKHRVECTVTFPKEETTLGEEEAIRTLGNALEIPGFRAGKAPLSVLRERIDPEKLFEETVRALLAKTITALVEAHHIHPIIPPKVEVRSRDPLTIRITFIERPTVTLRGMDKIKIEKKTRKIEEADIQKMIDSLLTQYPEKPALTDAFVQERFGLSSVADFRSRVEESMRRQEEEVEQQRREQELFEAIRKGVSADLAPELIAEEARTALEEWTERLQRQNLTLEQWLQQAGKKPEDFLKEIHQRAEERLQLRLGIEQLIRDRNIDVTEEEMKQLVQQALAPATPEDRARLMPFYQKGQRGYEQLQWQHKVERLIRQMLS